MYIILKAIKQSKFTDIRIMLALASENNLLMSFSLPEQSIHKTGRFTYSFYFNFWTHYEDDKAMKKAECQRFDASELWYWRRLLRVPWTTRRSNQSILKEISPEYPLEGLMLKLKLQYFDHLKQRAYHWKRPWCWERLKAAGEGDNRRWDRWSTSLTRWMWVWINSGSWW